MSERGPHGDSRLEFVMIRRRRSRSPRPRFGPILAAVLALTAMAVTACSSDDPADDGARDAAGSTAASPGTGPEGAAMGEIAEGVQGRAPAATGGLPSIVTLTPVDGSASEDPGAGDEEGGIGSAARRPARGEDAVIDQFGLAFSPQVLVAAAGSPVRFTNSEGAITHNVHIRSIAGDSTVFNGDTGPSEGVDVEFPGPGAYDVLCDMHPGMTAFVYVTDAPHAVAADTDGSFRFGPLEPGEYVARVWTASEGLGPERHVVIEGASAELDLRPPDRDEGGAPGP